MNRLAVGNRNRKVFLEIDENFNLEGINNYKYQRVLICIKPKDSLLLPKLILCICFYMRL